MTKVRNKKAVTKISVRSLLARRSRNLIAVFAIALTTLLFTSLFTIGGNMIEKSQESTMRQVGGSAHAGYKYLTWDEYKKVAAAPELKEVSYRILVADAENKELLKLRTEISYYEDLEAKFSFCYPKEGHMPREKYEVVASDLTLKALGIPCEIGQTVPLEFTIKGKKYYQDFVLSGWFQGDRICMSQCLCVSREYAREVAPTPTTSVMDQEIYADDYAGRICADFNFKSSFDLEGQLEKLNQNLGFEYASTGVNWAYMGSSADPQLVVIIVVLLAVIILSGYLIIYNIFYINVYSDIRFYGLLKTIGTTGKQLRSLVQWQAYLLSAAGIPAGLIAGFFCGKFLFPIVTGDLSMGEAFDTNVHVNPWIFLGSALFSLLTVYMSCIRPCRIAARVSPVEAVRFTEGNAAVGSGKHKREKLKKTKKITMQSFALDNIRRSRKKVVIVVLSLTMSLVLLNSIFSMVNGFDMDQFVANSIISDYMVADATVDNASMNMNNRVVDGVTEEFLTELKARPGVEDLCNVYYKDIFPTYTKEEWQRFENRIFSRMDELFAEMLAMGGEEEREYFDDQREERYVDGKAYGIGRLVFEKLENVTGELDWEKFSTGKYVLTNRFCNFGGDGTIKIDYYDVGEKVTLRNEAGESREYEVMAVAEMPYAAELQSYGIFDCTYILPEEEFFWYCGRQQPMKTLFQVDKENEDSMRDWITDYCENVNPDLTFTSKDTIVAEFDSMKNMYSIVGGLLAFILALIGILNFVNTMVTAILSRKQEFAMIEAVGMTGKQLLQMLMWEGAYYAIFTVIAALAVGSILNATVIRALGDQLFFYKWSFTIAPILLCVPFLILVVLLVPVLAYFRMCRTSVVERIRVAE